MSERKIYSYAPGMREYDPLVQWRGLVKGSGGKVNEWIRDRESGDDLLKAADAEENLVALVRKVFDLPPELLDQQVLDVLAHFNGWLAGKGGRG